MTAKRKQKTIRLDYLRNRSNNSMAAFTLFSGPAEARISVNEKQFVAITESTGVSLSPGTGKHINIQALPQNMRYGGLLQDLPFPLSIIPVTPVTPMPNQVIVPPLLGLVPTLASLAALLALFPA